MIWGSRTYPALGRVLQLHAFIVANTQHIPANLIEPVHTFRFTVGKTF